MKKRFALLNWSLLLAIVSSVVFQSVHSFEHILAEFTEHKCEHPHDTGAEQITHQHHDFDHCFSCEFSFSNFIAPEIFSFDFIASHGAIPYFFTASDTPHAFSGSAYSLRGPPVFIA